MAFVFHRGLGLPLAAIVFFTVALTAPPATPFLMPPSLLFVIVAVAIAAIVFSKPGAIPWLRMSRALARVRPSGHRDHAGAAIIVAAGTCVRTLEEPNRSEAADALDLGRMDDDGGWQMPRPPLVIVVGLILSGQLAFAQDMSRYRGYVLESSLESVVAASGAHATEAKTLHERPAAIQQLEWRAPYVDSRNTQADPVRDISFTFYNDALYQVIVNYDRDRTEGLTNIDIVESLSSAYGAPTHATAKTRTSPPSEAFPESIVVARWENAESLLTLVRGTRTPEFQLILVSKPLSARAQSAVREATRLDAIEAPRREAEQRKKEASDTSVALDKTRIKNKAAFRP